MGTGALTELPCDGLLHWLVSRLYLAITIFFLFHVVYSSWYWNTVVRLEKKYLFWYWKHVDTGSFLAQKDSVRCFYKKMMIAFCYFLLDSWSAVVFLVRLTGRTQHGTRPVTNLNLTPSHAAKTKLQNAVCRRKAKTSTKKWVWQPFFPPLQTMVKLLLVKLLVWSTLLQNNKNSDTV